MSNHRNPQASVSKQAPSDNFNPGDAIELPYSELVELEALTVATNQRHEHAAPAARTIRARRSRCVRRRADAHGQRGRCPVNRRRLGSGEPRFNPDHPLYILRDNMRRRRARDVVRVRVPDEQAPLFHSEDRRHEQATV
jgi:hypothetical protein